MILCIYESIALIYSDLLTYCKILPSKIGADHLTPLVIYVTIHAKLSFPNAILELILSFIGDQQILSGEVNYYITTWATAVGYITKVTKEGLKKTISKENNTEI
eukprot:c33566_g1_i1.p1 GENE.c33566_g1_i1~~c33566_g1_i1.p1  ORF type:complete len:104 (-),score=30.00 c33566_g1_i1:83-394(-)